MEQFNVAMKILMDIYGMPNWETKPKDGQSSAEIRKVWEEQLGNYNVEQVKQACYRLAKYRKSMTFPTISHIMAELCDDDGSASEYRIEQGNKREAIKMYSYLISHSAETIPPLSKLACQRTIWNLFKVAVDGFDPDNQISTAIDEAPTLSEVKGVVNG